MPLEKSSSAGSMTRGMEGGGAIVEKREERIRDRGKSREEGSRDREERSRNHGRRDKKAFNIGIGLGIEIRLGIMSGK